MTVGSIFRRSASVFPPQMILSPVHQAEDALKMFSVYDFAVVWVCKRCSLSCFLNLPADFSSSLSLMLLSSTDSRGATQVCPQFKYLPNTMRLAARGQVGAFSTIQGFCRPAPG